MKRPVVTVAVPYYILDRETEAMTHSCIASFLDTMEPEDELITVDDCSPYLHGLECDARHTKNRGNAAAWNTLVMRAEGRVILLADNDITANYWREPMLHALKRADIVFPRVFNLFSGRDQEHLAGECFMFRKELWKRLGPFDEGFHSYFEDTDWFMRCITGGGRLKVASEATVEHRSSATFRKMPEARKRLYEQNKVVYEKRWDGKYPHL